MNYVTLTHTLIKQKPPEIPTAEVTDLLGSSDDHNRQGAKSRPQSWSPRTLQKNNIIASQPPTPTLRFTATHPTPSHSMPSDAMRVNLQIDLQIQTTTSRTKCHMNRNPMFTADHRSSHVSTRFWVLIPHIKKTLFLNWSEANDKCW